MLIAANFYTLLIKFWNFGNGEQLTRVTDTTSAQARRGKDIQGIPWDRLHITRENYRKTRLEQYKNYENVPLSGDRVDKVYFLLIFVCLKAFYVIFFFNLLFTLSIVLLICVEVQANGEGWGLLRVLL